MIETYPSIIVKCDANFRPVNKLMARSMKYNYEKSTTRMERARLIKMCSIKPVALKFIAMRSSMKVLMAKPTITPIYSESIIGIL